MLEGRAGDGVIVIVYKPSENIEIVTYLTSGSEWQVPADITRAWVQLIGAGAGADERGGGEGGEYVAHWNLPLVPGAIIKYSIGKAGEFGKAGGETRFGRLRAKGGRTYREAKLDIRGSHGHP